MLTLRVPKLIRINLSISQNFNIEMRYFRGAFCPLLTHALQKHGSSARDKDV